jgi:nitroreductase
MARDLDTPIVCQNIMPAARSPGIGICRVYFGQLPFDDREVRRALEMQKGKKVYGPILPGYPKEGFPEASQKRPPVIKWI